ncbi:AAA family ATPase [Candidatus Marithrix sp. Canyon 246]|uniref:AAA family ATPase n=1 Tax=Candidatus Marithrix sp. Canyon 246 TaxID=1827136 RepID=UPI000849F44D|nr:AAA family ATPase [Candidatus Marithrix sp. Canyon 246]
MSSKGKSYTLSANELGEPILIRLEAQHHGNDGSVVSFDFAKESAGTQQLAHFLPILFDLLSSEKVYIVDELDHSLHALLPKLFLDNKSQNEFRFKYLKGLSSRAIWGNSFCF